MSKLLFNILFAFIWLFALLPLRVLYLFSDINCFFIYRVFGYRKKVVWENLSNSFPEKTDKEKRIIMRRIYRYFCDFFIESIKMIHLSDKTMKKRVVFNSDYINATYDSGKNLIAIVGHMSNWLWQTYMNVGDNYYAISPFHPLKNNEMESFFSKLRNRFIDEAIPMKQFYKRLMEIRKEGKLFSAAFVADQNTPLPDNQPWLKFLNQDTVVMEGPERIAQKTNSVVVYLKMNKIKRGYYEIEVIPITEDIKNEERYFVTKRYFEMLEEHIKEQPECWLWTHRRWKHKHPPENAKIIQ